MKINVINCFCTIEEGSGNPAAIVTEFKGNDQAKQKLAKDLETPVTVFISDIKNQSCHLEFFYPDTEMPLCLHGTLGAGYFLLNESLFSNLVCTTKNLTQLLVRKMGEIIQVKVSSQPTPEAPFDEISVCQMLNLESNETISTEYPFVISSVGSPKLLVPLVSLELLNRLKPNFELIKKWSIEYNVNGLYVYTNDSRINSFDFYARGFNPKTGHTEDAATGVAAAALALLLEQSIVVGQGEFIKRPSEMTVTYEDSENIWVGGMAR